MTKMIRVLRFTLGLLVRLVGLVLLLLVLALLFVGFTPLGARLLADRIAVLASKPGQLIAIEAPTGLLTGRLRVPSVTLSDSKGAYASIRDLAVDWSPLALPSLTFRAEEISAGHVEFLRPPLPEAPVSQGSGTFSLPVALDITRITLPDISIGKAAAGHDFKLSASGSAKADNASILGEFSVARQDLPEAKAMADLAFLPAANSLTLKGSLDEPRDGMLAALLNLPGRPAMHLSVDGNGPISDWSGEFSAALDGTQAFTARTRHIAGAEGGHRLILTGEGAAEPLMPPTLRALFAGKSSFTFDGTLAPSGKLTVAAGSLTSASLNLALAGTYDPLGQNDLTLKAAGVNGPVDIPIPAGKEAARLGVQSLDLSLQGPAEKARLSIAGELASVNYPGYRLDRVQLSGHSDALDLKTRSGSAQLQISFETGTFADANIARLLPGPFTLTVPLSLSPGILSATDATLESARLGGTLSGQYDLDSHAAKGDFRLFALPEALPPALAGKIDGKLALSGAVARSGGGAITASGLKLTSDILTAGGDVTLDGGTLQAGFRGTLPKLSALLADAKGEAAFSLSATGDIAAPDVNASLTAAKAVLSGRTLDNLTLTASGKADPKSPSARIEASGMLGGQTIDVHTELSASGGVTTLPVMKLDIGKNHLDGALRLSPDFRPEGGISFDLPDIGLVAALAGEKASGDLKGKMQFANTKGHVSATVSASGKGITRGDLVIRDPRVALDIADLAAFSASGSVTAADIAKGSNRVSSLTLAFNRTGETTGFDLKAAYDGKPLIAKGAVTLAGGKTSVALSTLGAQPKGIALKLARPTTIDIQNGTAQIRDLTIAAGKGSVSLSGSAGATLALNAQISNLPLSLANAVAPGLNAEGAVSGTVTVSGKGATPVVDYHLAFDRAAVAQIRSAGLQPLAIKADGRFENNQLRLETTVANGDGLALKGDGNVALSGAKPLNMGFSGKLPFKALAGVLAQQGLDVGGTAEIDIKIAGSAAAPVITGRITSRDAKLVDVRHNIALKNIALAVSLDRTRATIDKLSGTLSTGGTVSVTGSVGLQPGSNFPADLKVALAKAAYVDGKVVSTVVDGNLTLTGPLLGNPKLGGQLALGRSAITIPQKLPASLAQINVQHRNESKAVASQNTEVMARTSNGRGASTSIGLDIALSAPRIFVQGRGIDAELGGDLTLRGTAADPVVSGGFKMKRGRMTILSRRLDFTTGTITFGGDLTPTLDMAADADSGSVTVTVTISGPANDPVIGFSSSPSLPQDEVLAQLIFQQSLSRLSVLQIAQLADAAAQLAGGRSTSLLQGLRANLGIDDLDISSDANGQAQVKAGKYLNDKTYIQVEQGAASGSKASINLDVGRGVKLKGEAGSDGAGAAGIFYEKEY